MPHLVHIAVMFFRITNHHACLATIINFGRALRLDCDHASFTPRAQIFCKLWDFAAPMFCSRCRLAIPLDNLQSINIRRTYCRIRKQFAPPLLRHFSCDQHRSCSLGNRRKACFNWTVLLWSCSCSELHFR